VSLPTEFEKELTTCLKSLDLSKGDHTYITGNIGALGRIRLDKSLKLKLLLKAFRNNIGEDACIFSPSASMNLCNTDIPFDIEDTPSNAMGAFAEYFRQLPDSIRSNHPFWSISGQGEEAFRLKNVTRHAFGAGSPWSIFLDLDTTQVNLGIHPSKAVTLIHHLETTIGVPYRYTKEFIHPIKHGEEIINEPFYQSVMYSNCSIRKKLKLNEHFFDALKSKRLLNEVQHSSGLMLWSFKMRDFYSIVLDLFKENIYTYLEEEPLIKPYTK